MEMSTQDNPVTNRMIKLLLRGYPRKDVTGLPKDEGVKSTPFLALESIHDVKKQADINNIVITSKNMTIN
jgi:hypothetical protein